MRKVLVPVFWQQVTSLGQGVGQFIEEGSVSPLRQLEERVQVPLAGGLPLAGLAVVDDLEGARTSEQRDGEGENSVLEMSWRKMKWLIKHAFDIEEMFSVWVSLRGVDYGTRGRVYQDWDEARIVNLEKQSIKIYDLHGLYPNFREVADHMSVSAAAALVEASLGTYNPRMALWEMLEVMRVVLAQGASHIAAGERFLSAEAVTRIMGPTQERLGLGADERWIDDVLNEGGAHAARDFIAYFSKQESTGPVVFTFDEQGVQFRGPTELVDSDEHVEAVWCEAMLEQLTTGRGLVCPFWGARTFSNGACCGLRDLMEGIWSNTLCTASTWTREGCLRE
ncbi:MAG TPA: hypothetical protein VJO34_11120 [Methylomirabilota bacterium]|nr:hypothetical protein [Methylomirabilota bacterium]